jgi:manganese/zinc/iron transport system substrate-binding protein
MPIGKAHTVNTPHARALALVLTLGAAFAPLAGCEQQPRTATAPKHYPYQIVTTTAMIADIARAVAGEHANVENLMGAGVDPHLYSATPSDIRSLAEADYILYNGLLLEGKMTDTLVNLANQKPVQQVTRLIDRESLLEPEAFAGHFDPHVWMDVDAWALVVDAVRDALAEFDPPHAADYAKNAAAYRQQLEKLDAYVHQVVASIPTEQRVLITAHDAFNYFGRAYDIEVVGIQGLSTESEAGLARINALVDMLVQRNVQAAFVETSVDDKNVLALVEGAAARNHTVRVGGELFSDAMGAPGTYRGTYIGMIDHNATTIARALGGNAPADGFQGRLDTTE